MPRLGAAARARFPGVELRVSRLFGRHAVLAAALLALARGATLA